MADQDQALHKPGDHLAHPVLRGSVEVGDPGFALGLAGFITSFFVGVVGFILSLIGMHQSRAIGKKNPFALAGAIIGGVQVVLTVLGIIGLIIGVNLLIKYCDAHPDATSCGNESNSSEQQPASPMDDSQMRRTF